MNMSDSGKSRRLSPAEMRKKKIKRFAIGSIPFGIYILSVALISVGILQYIEQESLLAIFLTKRDAQPVYAAHGDDWDDVINTDATKPTEGEIEAVPTPEVEGERLRVPFYYIGEQIGVLRIPSVEIDVSVMQGDRESEFRLGAGHYPGSLLPGQDGNILLAAHRTNHFRNFYYLEMGDEVEFATTYGRFQYKITDMFLIDGNDHSIAGETDEEQLTMYTCYPFGYIGNAPQRFVVVADLISSELYQHDDIAGSEAE
jgi:LPXTG-site transpeptidase (sortase) family protein